MSPPSLSHPCSGPCLSNQARPSQPGQAFPGLVPSLVLGPRAGDIGCQVRKPQRVEENISEQEVEEGVQVSLKVPVLSLLILEQGS